MIWISRDAYGLPRGPSKMAKKLSLPRVLPLLLNPERCLSGIPPLGRCASGLCRSRWRIQSMHPEEDPPALGQPRLPVRHTWASSFSRRFAVAGCLVLPLFLAAIMPGYRHCSVVSNVRGRSSNVRRECDSKPPHGLQAYPSNETGRQDSPEIRAVPG